MHAKVKFLEETGANFQGALMVLPMVQLDQTFPTESQCCIFVKCSCLV